MAGGRLPSLFTKVLLEVQDRGDLQGYDVKSMRACTNSLGDVMADD
jgi:hypothetical protein